MSDFLLVIVISVLLASCDVGQRELLESSDEIPDHPFIKARTIALDSIHSRNFVKCDENAEPINSLMNCTIKFGDIRFIKLHTVVFKKDGKVDRFYRYMPEGPIETSANELFQDTNLANNFRVMKNNSFLVDKIHNKLVHNTDTFSMIGHWPKEKLLFTENNSTDPENTVRVYMYE
jgi:hypothetical protein